MGETFKIMKEHFVLLLGTGLFTYGLFSFLSFHRYYKNLELGGLSGLYPRAPYDYNHTSLILLTIGAILIVIGLLKIRKKKVEE